MRFRGNDLATIRQQRGHGFPPRHRHRRAHHRENDRAVPAIGTGHIGTVQAIENVMIDTIEVLVASGKWQGVTRI
jgi:hypothetical protein